MITFGGMRGGVSALQFADDSSLVLMTGSCGNYDVFELVRGKRRRVWAANGQMWFDTILQTYVDGALISRDHQIMRLDFVPPSITPIEIVGLADRRPLFFSSQISSEIYYCCGQQFGLVNVATQQAHCRGDFPASPDYGTCICVPGFESSVIVFSQFGKRHADRFGPAFPPRLRILRSSDGSILSECGPLQANVYCVAASADGHRVAAGVGRSLVVFDADTGSARSSRQFSNRLFTQLEFTSGDRQILCTQGDTTVHVFDSESCELLHTLDLGIGKVRQLIISADRSMAAAAGSSGKVAIWDLDP